MTKVSDESSTVIEIETLIHRIVNEPMELEQYDATQLGVWGAMERRTDLRTFTGWAKWA